MADTPGWLYTHLYLQLIIDNCVVQNIHVSQILKQSQSSKV